MVINTGIEVVSDRLAAACELGPEDGRERLRRWQALFATYGCGRESQPGAVAFQYRAEPEAVTELDTLVAAERRCCPHLGWDVTTAGDMVVLTITGSDEDLQALPG